MTVFTGTVFRAMKRTLDNIVTDKTDGYEARAVYSQWMQVKSMSDNWEEDAEYGGPGLASEMSEGTEIPAGTLAEGTVTRYTARKFGLRVYVSDEAIEDNKYDRVINMARRLKRSMFKTIEFDTTNILVRATDTSYPGGDGFPLASASHTLPHGGTFSNILPVAMSPSRAAVIVATSQIRKYPSQDGIVEGYQPMKVICPTEQWAVWDGLVMSERAPEPGAYNEINVVKKLSLKVVTNQYWDNTTTNWGIITDCDNGLQIRMRRKPRSSSWVENSQELMSYAITARWDTKWSDPRCFLFSDA